MSRFLTMMFVILLSVVLIGCSNSNEGIETVGSSEGDNDEVIKWNFSTWGGSRAWTYPVEDWAEAMEEKTDGQWVIDIHYGEALSPAEEHIDGMSNGMFEAGSIAPFYSPGKLPLQQVYDLPFLPPVDHRELIEVLMELWEHPEIVKEMDSYNIVPLLPGMPTQYEYMGKEKIEKAEDFNGVKISGMSAEQGRVFEKFGAVPTPMPAPEVFNSLDRGTIDGSVFSYSYMFGSYNLHEASNYSTVNIAAGSPIATFYANKDAWDSLPDEFKEIHNEYLEEVFIDNQISYYEEADKKWIKEFEDNGIETISLPDKEREKLLEASQEVWDDWVEEWKDRGPTQEILDYVLEKRMEISGY